MAFLTFLPEASSSTETKKQKPSSSSKRKKKQKQASSWDQIKNLLTCKQVQGSTAVHDPSKNNIIINSSLANYSKLGPCISICTFRDVVHGNIRVVHRPDSSSERSTVGSETCLLRRKTVNRPRSLTGNNGSSVNGTGGTYTSSSRGMQFRKLSGCYECHMIVDPSRYPTPRTTICTCPNCGEVFPKIESLELHQAVRHADRIVWVAVAVLVGLFMFQRFGTDRVGYTFAPILCIWFSFIAGIGVYNFIKYDPSVVKAINPIYITHYFTRNQKQAWISLGGIVLAITGTEALFADVGHFTVRSIQISMQLSLIRHSYLHTPAKPISSQAQT